MTAPTETFEAVRDRIMAHVRSRGTEAEPAAVHQKLAAAYAQFDGLLAGLSVEAATAAHRLGGVQLGIAPEQGTGGQRLDGGVDHLGRDVGEQCGQLGPGHAVGRGEQHRIEHLQRRGVQLVEGAVDRHRDGQAGRQPHDVGRRRARRRSSAKAGTSDA